MSSGLVEGALSFCLQECSAGSPEIVNAITREPGLRRRGELTLNEKKRNIYIYISWCHASPDTLYSSFFSVMEMLCNAEENWL